MKKKNLTLLLGLAAAFVLAGSSDAYLAHAEEIVVEEGMDDEYLEEGDYYEEDYLEEAFEEVELEPITPSDYLVKNPGDYVTPTAYEGLEVTQYIYEFTDDMIQEQITSELEMYGEEVEVDRPSQNGDTVYVDMTYSVQGSDEEPYTESTYYYLGYEELGADFDKELTGASAGDTLQFSITFDDSIYMEEWADQTVDFEVLVTGVCETSIPEYNDEFVQEYLGYDSTTEYEEDLYSTLVSEYEETSYADAVEALFSDAIGQSVYSGYPQELYDSCKEEVIAVYESFAESFGAEDFYELFNMTEEDIDIEVLDTVNRRLFTSWICAEHDLEITEEDYVTYVNEYALQYGYPSGAAFEEDYSRASIVWSLYESKVGDFLYEAASVSEELYTEGESDMDEIEFLDDEEMTEEITE